MKSPRLIATALLIVLGSQPAFADVWHMQDSAHFVDVSIQQEDLDDVIQFRYCDAKTNAKAKACKAIGRKSGYTRSELIDKREYLESLSESSLHPLFVFLTVFLSLGAGIHYTHLSQTLTDDVLDGGRTVLDRSVFYSIKEFRDDLEKALKTTRPEPKPRPNS